MRVARPFFHILFALGFGLALLSGVQASASGANGQQEQQKSQQGAKFTRLDDAAESDDSAELLADDNDINPPRLEYQIHKGDTLSGLFDRFGFGYATMSQIMAADVNILALDTLQPGDTLRFWVEEGTTNLTQMEIEFNLASKVRYTRENDNTFSYEDIQIEGDWTQQVISGEVYGSFSVSANKAGLGNDQIASIVDLLQDKVNFARDLQAGDEFGIVQRIQYIDGVATGNKEIEAIVINSRRNKTAAYLHKDGQYYDANGESLQRAFIRKPVSNGYRITSSFNPRRKHPVTGKITPHNGTDFGTPSGTRVNSTGDGTIIMVRNHPYAGKYVVVDHGSNYKTRYLHLSRISVKKGQKVSRGQQIGLSGATGRVTGAHLHFELLYKNRAVNAMTANIPMASSIDSKELNQFIAKRNELDLMLKQLPMLAQSQEKVDNPAPPSS